MLKLKTISTFCVVVALTACGGGGGSASSTTSAEGLYIGTTSNGRSMTGIVLDNNNYWFLYSGQNNSATIAGAIQGTYSSNNGGFSSNNAVDFNLEGLGINPANVTGTNVSKQSISATLAYPGSIQTVNFNSSYNVTYERIPNLAAIAGKYTGRASVPGGTDSATLIITTTGAINGSVSGGCKFTGSATAHARGNVYDISIAFGGGVCANGTDTVNGIGFFDTTTNRLYGVALNSLRSNGFIFSGINMLESISVTPVNSCILPNMHKQLTAIGHYSDGTSQDISALVTWASSSTAIESVSISGLVTGLSLGNSTITATSAMGGIIGSAAQKVCDRVWLPTASLATPRDNYTATLLPSGKVLVVGGSGAELYDPTAGTWSAAGNLATARGQHTATRLQSGKVLVVGGYRYGGAAGGLASTELYDPTNNSWSAAASLTTARVGHTATLLPSGKVLVVGGMITTHSLVAGVLASTELYDPTNNSWSATANLVAARDGHAATLLPSGKVLVIGGSKSYLDSVGLSTLASAELYDPSANSWSTVASLATARNGLTATLLPSGKVLVVGGRNSDINNVLLPPIRSAELYDPAANVWSAAGSLATGRYHITATLMPNGQVMAVVGDDLAGNMVSTELYDPTSNTWVSECGLENTHNIFTATLLQSGKVLAIGTGVSAEIY